MRRASDFPELAPVAARWTALRDEARAAFDGGQLPSLVPLFPQPRGGRAYAERFPVTAGLCRGVRGVLGAALSVLPPGSRRPADGVTALLCLDGELVVAGDALAGGGLVILDGDTDDEARNDGPGDGLALLVRLAAAPETPAARTARRVLHDVFEAGRPASELCAPGPAADLDRLATMWRSAFPDLRLELLELVGEGARVSCAVRVLGLQTGRLYNIPATGAGCAWTAAFFFTVDGTRVVALTVVWDLFALLQQLREALRVG